MKINVNGMEIEVKPQFCNVNNDLKHSGYIKAEILLSTNAYLSNYQAECIEREIMRRLRGENDEKV